ncbi:MAG: toll/interleukin-1 receptor domain-containing protein [Thermoanaerobaculia bacterium]
MSHASEDKARFVEPFAKALRANGVDASFDKWEVLAGDSLVQKIFGALGEAEFLIAVLSPFSIKKPWVVAELDVAVVRRIQGETRIIPVKLDLDRSDVPVPLQAIKWVSVDDPANFAEPLREVLDAIYGRSNKPPLGPAPGFADIVTPDIPNLNQTDKVVLKILFDRAIEGDYFSIDTDIPKRRAADLGIPEASFMESLDILRSEGYLDFKKMIGGSVPNVTLTWRAAESACKAWVPNYEQRVKRICAEVVNREHGVNNKKLGDEISEHFWLINHVFDGLANQGLIQVSQAFVGYRSLSIWQVSPQLKRKFQG